MPQLNNCHAWVSVDGAELSHYAIETDTYGGRVTCWIPSEVGKVCGVASYSARRWNASSKAFAVNWRTSGGMLELATSGRLTIDGTYCGGRVTRAHDFSCTQKSYVRTSSTTVRPFMFAALESTDDDAYLDAPGAQSLGDIQLDIWIVRATPSRLVAKTLRLNDPGKVHERAKKAVAHRVKFGHEVTSGARARSSHITKIRRAATFVFKYRSIDVLRATEIAPPSASGPVESRIEGKMRAVETQQRADDGNDEAAREELRALRERIDMINAKLVKREGQSQSILQVKSEPQAEGRSREVIDLTINVKAEGQAFIPGEIIDLT